MMTPGQINTQRFNTVNKGGYRTVEVDNFLQKVYQCYSRLYSDNNELFEKNESMATQVAEYEKSKSAIAQALIWAQSKADESVEEAKKVAANLVTEASQQAESMMAVKKAEAEAYYTERTQKAEERLKAAQEAFENIKTEAERFSDKYMLDVNNKAKQIVSDATEKASTIVAAAFSDVKAAREKADEIISKTNAELEEYRNEVARLKKEMTEFIEAAQKAADKISVNSNLDFNIENDKSAPEIKVEEPEIGEFVYESKLLDNIENISDSKSDPKKSVSDSDVKKDVNSVVVERGDKLSPLDLISENDGTKQYTPSSSNSTDIPDVNSYISKIFDSVASEKKEKVAKFSIDYKEDLDELISEVLDGSGYGKDNSQKNDRNESYNLDDFFGGEEDFE